MSRSTVPDYGVSEDYDTCVLCHTRRPKRAMDLSLDGTRYECTGKEWCHRQREERSQAATSGSPSASGSSALGTSASGSSAAAKPPGRRRTPRKKS